MANYRGIEDIEFVWNGEWADPDLFYKGYRFNYWDVENTLWGDYVEQDCEGNADKGDDYGFDLWLKRNKDCVYGYLNDWIAANKEMNNNKEEVK